VLPVSNLAAVAAGCARVTGADFVLACMDARMGEVYWAAFDCRGAAPVLQGREQLTSPAAVELPGDGPWQGAGHGFAAHPAIAERLSLAAVDGARLPRASDIARIAAPDLAAGRGIAPALGLPVYLRDDVVHRR
jgi:tRNA threonylcarbamoyladenosine biosynthesis protein TsaB